MTAQKLPKHIVLVIVFKGAGTKYYVFNYKIFFITLDHIWMIQWCNNTSLYIANSVELAVAEILPESEPYFEMLKNNTLKNYASKFARFRQR